MRPGASPPTPPADDPSALTTGYLRATKGRFSTMSVMSSATIRKLFNVAAERVKMRTADGLGPYGVRRAFTDAGKEAKLSRDGLTALGGWADPQMADNVYADQDAMYSAEEARDFRAKSAERTTSV